MSVDPFLGVWVLEAEGGGAPLAVYSILGSAKRLFFHARWTNDGMHEVRSEGVPDGVLYTMGEHEKRLSVIDGALITEVRKDGKVVHRAVRRIEGDTLHIDQGEGAVVYKRSEVKQVLVYRADLSLGKGAIATQCAHASLAVFLDKDEGGLDHLAIPLDGPMAFWSRGERTKVVLSVADEAALFAVYAEAQKRGLPSVVHTHTEVGGVPTRTVVAVGPAAIAEINAITAPGGLVPTRLV